MKPAEKSIPKTEVAPTGGFHFRRAFTAVRKLTENPDDTAQVFTIIESLSGGTLNRITRRFRKDPVGQRLLREKPDIVPLLQDREALRRMPAGSLAHAYLAFVESEGISADGLVAASSAGEHGIRSLASDELWIHERMRDTHDLWHATLGYKGDVLGEVALLGFTLPQTKNPAIGLIVLAAVLRYRTPQSFGLLRQAIERGIRAAWLPMQEWEALLPLPVEEVRRRLAVGDLPKYTPIRSSDLRAQGVIGPAMAAA